MGDADGGAKGAEDNPMYVMPDARLEEISLAANALLLLGGAFFLISWLGAMVSSSTMAQAALKIGFMGSGLALIFASFLVHAPSWLTDRLEIYERGLVPLTRPIGSGGNRFLPLSEIVHMGFQENPQFPDTDFVVFLTAADGRRYSVSSRLLFRHESNAERVQHVHRLLEGFPGAILAREAAYAAANGGRSDNRSAIHP